MSKPAIQIAIVDPDPIFRLGLTAALQSVSDFQVIADGETSAEVLQQLAQGRESASLPPVDLVILDWEAEATVEGQRQALQQAYQPWSRYPQLAVLLLTAKQERSAIAFAQALGIRGYCRKGIAIADLRQAIRTCAAGQLYGFDPNQNAITPQDSARGIQTSRRGLVRFRDRLRLSGIEQIEATIQQLRGDLQNPALSVLERAVIAGRLRELVAARWVVNRLLGTPESADMPRIRETVRTTPPPPENLGSRRSSNPRSTLVSISSRSLTQISPTSVDVPAHSFFGNIESQLQYSLKNLTGEPLEIDILREEKRRELLKIVLNRFIQTTEELKQGQVNPLALSQKVEKILQDLWSEVTTDFFGKYYHINIGEVGYDVVPILLDSIPRVQVDILQKIPLVMELFSYLLYETPLMIDNISYSYGTPEANQRAEILTQNLMIQVANGVIQPLLNRFSDVVEIKQDFYDQKLLSSREIERFRNNLSWKYRQANLVGEPKAMFESQYYLFAFDYRGIKKVSIYYPRRQELERLKGLRFAVTLILELRDAIAPRVRAIISFLGSGVIYLLTQIVGKGIGLIGRGILQGLGSSIPESRFSRNNEARK